MLAHSLSAVVHGALECYTSSSEALHTHTPAALGSFCCSPREERAYCLPSQAEKTS